jgi:hypothetical protein
MKRSLLPVLPVLLLIISCKKDKTASSVYTPVPFLTGKLWTLDTITINPPATYNQLSTDDQRIYDLALAWEVTAELTFKEDGTVKCGGNWDFAYYGWRMIHNDTDIEVMVSNGTRDTLFNWTANSQQFTYRRTFSPSFDCTIVYH